MRAEPEVKGTLATPFNILAGLILVMSGARHGLALTLLPLRLIISRCCTTKRGSCPAFPATRG